MIELDATFAFEGNLEGAFDAAARVLCRLHRVCGILPDAANGVGAAGGKTEREQQCDDAEQRVAVGLGCQAGARGAFGDDECTDEAESDKEPQLRAVAGEELLDVMDAVGSDRAAIIGESEGGPLALLFAAYTARKASSLRFICAGSSARSTTRCTPCLVSDATGHGPQPSSLYVCVALVHA